jgi:head-tail adaptor
MRRIPAGEMQHVVTIRQHKIEAGTTALDSFGQVSASSTAWTTTVTRRAKIEQLSGDEATIARQLYSHASYKVTLDYDATIASTGGSRRAVVFNNRFLHIGAVLNPDMENKQLELLCGEER